MTEPPAQAERTQPSPPAARRRGAIAAGLAAGIGWSALTFLALPPVNLWLLGLLAPAPIVLLGWSARRPWLAAIGASIGSVPLWAYHHHWIADVSFAGVFPLIAYLALWIGLAVVVLSRARRAAGALGPAVAAPTVWVGLEFVRGELAFGGYPWFMAGHPMIGSEVISRAASLGGVYLVSWLVVSVGAIAVAHRQGGRLSRRSGLGVSVVLLGLLAASAITGGAEEPTGERVRVASLQTNVPQDNKLIPTREQLTADFRSLVGLMDEAAADGAELLVTPETVLPGGLLSPEARAVFDEPFGEALLREQARVGVPMLAGCTTLGGLRAAGDRLTWDDTFNSVFLLTDGAVRGPRYDKLRPTPFGETLPYVQSLPWLRDLVLQIGLGASGMDFGLTPGDAPVAFAVPIRGAEVSVSAPICFESSMAPTVRRLVNAAGEQGRPTELLVVMTNDGWFGLFDAGREMHLLQARWRCVEHRLPMVRCANTGVSAVIDHRGRVVASLPARQAGVLVRDLQVGGGGGTAYQSLGETVGWACFAATGVLVMLSFRKPTKDGGTE